MRIIGLTGGIASGKSTVSREFQALGVPVIDADKIAHAALKKGTIGWRRVTTHFGNGILLENGEINRAHLGNIVFSDPAKRKELNSALSLPITVGIFWELFKHWIVGSKVVVLDVPLLFEAKLNSLTRPIIVVWVDHGTQEQRLIKRDKISTEQAFNRIHAQLPLDWKRDRANIVIDNCGTLEETRAQVHHIWTQVTAPLSWREYISSRSSVAAVVGIAFLLWFVRRC
eukprot:c25235_g1_i2 orf=318-1001(-)